ncbi:MAG TPA: LAGLIDADG family homing endonuclease, partial [Methylomirabilota bacterium]|nr:LAGLIDADG family homing endonuclease [Methylomirabilota bacterium]
MIEPDFGHWFAGFTDGEGCFQIKKNRLGWVCRFKLKLRADDVFILNKIQQTLQIGKLQLSIDNNPNRNSKPTISFAVENKKDCLFLCDLFTKFPLRAKKAKDFEIWKEAVYKWAKIISGGSARHHSELNVLKWSEMEQLYEQIKQIRIYDDNKFEGVIL